MIKCVGFSSEHKKIPNHLLLSSETTNRNKSANIRDLKTEFYSNYSYDVYCTYAWFETDKVDTSTLPDFYEGRIPIAVMDYRPKYSKRTKFVFKEPIWGFIEEARTSEIQ